MAPVDNLTFAIFLCAELGFLGFRVNARKHTPFNWGLKLRPLRAAEGLLFFLGEDFWRGFFIT